jgi:C4-type Zn-finger protein
MLKEQVKFEALCPRCSRHYVESNINRVDIEIYKQVGYTVKLCKQCDSIDYKKLMSQRWSY